MLNFTGPTKDWQRFVRHSATDWVVRLRSARCAGGFDMQNREIQPLGNPCNQTWRYMKSKFEKIPSYNTKHGFRCFYIIISVLHQSCVRLPYDKSVTNSKPPFHHMPVDTHLTALRLENLETRLRLSDCLLPQMECFDESNNYISYLDPPGSGKRKGCFMMVKIPYVQEPGWPE